jgi:hypothetical protein
LVLLLLVLVEAASPVKNPPPSFVTPPAEPAASQPVKEGPAQ